jgi:hypothetical protein
VSFQAGYLGFDQANVPAILNKIQQLNNEIDPVRINFFYFICFLSIVVGLTANKLFSNFCSLCA